MRYDPTNPIDPDEWLALDEDERCHVVQCWIAERTGDEFEDCVIEAVPFMLVENHIAENDPPVTRATLERLMKAGIDRVLAVAMMAEVVYEQLQAIVEEKQSFDMDAYAAALERLDPEEIKALADPAADEPESTIPEISSDERQVLIDFGERHADEGALLYPEIAGFLFAVMACPDLIKPSEWTELVQGDAVFADAGEAEAVMQARMALMNWISECMRVGQPAIPDDCKPGPDPMRILEADNDFSRWSRGFTTGHHWLSEVWNGVIEEDTEDDFALGSALVVLSFFSDRKTAEMLIEDSVPEEGTVEDAAQAFHPMIDAAIQDYAAISLQYRRAPATSERREPVRSQKVGRNEPCPCGSGRKYKHCHGRIG